MTIFADGVRGNLTKVLMRRLQLGAGRHPQLFALGIKELWQVPADRLQAGTVMHTMGYPLRFEEFGGGFIYAMEQGAISLGFVAGLDYRDPLFDPHVAFNRFKQHPFVKALLDGGQMVRYGAKALPEGGWYTIPRCYADGALIVGDAAGFMNSMRLKGIHLAMRSGMLAAETASTTAKPSMIFERNRRVGSLSDRGQIRFDIATLNPRLLSESQSNREYGLRHLVPKTRAEWIKGRKYAPNPRAGAYAARPP